MEQRLRAFENLNMCLAYYYIAFSISRNINKTSTQGDHLTEPHSRLVITASQTEFFEANLFLICITDIS
jgi:hypothetical protein